MLAAKRATMVRRYEEYAKVAAQVSRVVCDVTDNAGVPRYAPHSERYLFYDSSRSDCLCLFVVRFRQVERRQATAFHTQALDKRKLTARIERCWSLY